MTTQDVYTYQTTQTDGETPRGGSRAGKTVRQPDPPAPGELRQTPREIEGPYFRLGAPERSNLLEPGDKPEIVLTGRVLNERGKPIAGAVVNLWSSDAVGNYDMLGYRYHGFVRTDAAGAYEFTSIVPGCYQPRDAKHFHVKVQGITARSPRSSTSRASLATKTTRTTRRTCWFAAPPTPTASSTGRTTSSSSR